MSILLILYNILYLLLYIPALAVCLYKSKIKGGNPHCLERLGLGLPEGTDKSSFWFHAASVGEVRSLAGIISTLRKSYPDFAIILSTFTETGYNVAENEIKADRTFLLPVENRWALKNAVKKYNVKIFFITDTELWPNTIMSVSSLVPLFLLNGRISDRTYKSYMKFSFIFSPILQRFSVIFARSGDDAARFKALSAGKAQIEVGGNIKYRIAPSPLNAEVSKITGRIALAASTHDPEERIFISTVPSLKKNFDRCVIVPRHINRAAEIKAEAEKNGLSAGLYSAKEFNKDILIVDALGLLESFYQTADKIFVGGSLSQTGGHNVFEALQYSKPVAVGPNTQNFNDIIPAAIEHGIVTVVKNAAELETYLTADSQPVEFKDFFDSLKAKQAQYAEKIEEQIKRCIGY